MSQLVAVAVAAGGIRCAGLVGLGMVGVSGFDGVYWVAASRWWGGLRIPLTL